MVHFEEKQVSPCHLLACDLGLVPHPETLLPRLGSGDEGTDLTGYWEDRLQY